MPDVKSISVLERSESGDRTVVEWVGIVKESSDHHQVGRRGHLDNSAKRCDFKMLRGDYTSYSGWWEFTPADGGTLFTSVVDFEYDVPLIGALIKA